MSRIKYTVIGLSAIMLLGLAFTPIVFAEDRLKTERSSVRTQVAETTSQTEEIKAERRANVEAKRTELQAKLEAMKQARTEKLDQKRLAACEKRETKINTLIQKRSEQGTKHLAVFQKIAERVQKFIADKNLTIENYDQLVAAIEAKEDAVEAAIEANTVNTFDCDAVDATAPVKLPRTSFDAVRDSLKEYRTAIKDLIVKVKSNNAIKTDTDTHTTDTQTEATGTEPAEGAAQ